MINAVLEPSGLTRPSPTAQMSVGETTASALSAVFTVGVGATVHEVPSQCSTRAVTPGDLPTAHTFFDVIAATPRSPPRPVPPGFGPVGTGTSAQAVPFQCSAHGTFGTGLMAVASPPTAQMSLAPTPCTAFSTSFRNCGFGPITCVQAAPFQCRIRPPSSSSSLVSPNTPTAHASVAVRANTPFRPLRLTCGLGLATSVQVVAAAAGGAPKS